MKSIVLMDGGMGQELIARSSLPTTSLWSAQVMMNEPEIVEAVHRAYIDSGAKVLTLNSYSATPERLARDASEDLFEPLQAKAISIAKDAIGDRDVQMAGCLPPLFGSYHPEHAPEYERCLLTYRRLVECQKGDVDIFLTETLASVKEIAAAVTAAHESGIPVWCGMTVDDNDGTKLRSGESVEEGIEAAAKAGAVAVGINCSRPEAVAQAVPAMKNSGLAFGGWANGFTNAAEDLAVGGIVDGMRKRVDLGPDAYADHVMAWVDAGATLVGGCCEVGPAHIETLQKRLTAAGFEITGQL